MQNSGPDESKAGIKLVEISRTSNMQMIHSNGRKRRGTKEPLGEGERGD